MRFRSFNTTSLFCDCQLSWVPIWLRDNNFERSVIAKCGHPQHLKGRNIFAVDSSEYKCGMCDCFESTLVCIIWSALRSSLSFTLFTLVFYIVGRVYFVEFSFSFCN